MLNWQSQMASNFGIGRGDITGTGIVRNMTEGPGEEVVSCERCNENSRSVKKGNCTTMCVVI